jgi:predicted nucleotidyltransferase
MCMKNIEEIKNKIKSVQNLLNSEYEVQEIGLFGSYIRGEARENSDLDILVSLRQDHNVGLIKFNSLKEFLSNLLGIKVDLVLKDGIKPALAKYILNEVVYL